jgi:hypothetical protein
MKLLHWVAWLLGAFALWFSIGWFGIKWMAIDPYFDRKIDAIALSVAPGAPSKNDVAEIEKARDVAFKATGLIGALVFGFLGGIGAHRYRPKQDRNPNGTSRASTDASEQES